MEEEHKKMLKQIYVFLSRCISYSFTCKQSSDRGYRFMNINGQILNKMKDKFNAYLQSAENIDSKDGIFNSVDIQYTLYSIHYTVYTL